VFSPAAGGSNAALPDDFGGAVTRAAIITGVLGAALLGASSLLPSAQVWSSLTPGNCAEYCEASQRCGELASRAAVQQPLNTWSNLAYVFFGLEVLLMTGAGMVDVLFALSMLVLGIGSLLFHATVMLEFQWLDVAGMYFVLVALIAAACDALWAPSRRGLIAAAVAADILLAAFKWRINTWIAIPGLGLCVTAQLWMMARRSSQSTGRLFAALALLAIGFLLQRLDVHRTLCWPESRIFQGHALWHVLTATALWLSYRFARPAEPRA
jgi:hypothetical protein